MDKSFKPLFLLSAILLCSICSNAQRVKLPYQDFVIVKDKIYVLTNKGVLKIFSAEHGTLLDIYAPTNQINYILPDHADNLIAINNVNEIKRLSNEGKWDKITTYTEGEIYAAAFNSANDCYLITDKGVEDLAGNRRYMPANEFSHSEWSGFGKANGWKGDNDYNYSKSTFMDSNDNLWTKSYHGEWGEDILFLTRCTGCLSIIQDIMP